MTSFYAGPSRPRLALATWSDLVAAVQTGATAETQWCELKADVPATSPGANTELAKDLASLTVDGGVLLIGVRDKASEEADIVGVDDSTLTGLASRIDQVAASRVAPPMHVVLHQLAGKPGSSRTVLVVEVPPSPAAPHMVDGSYWGRSATGKRTLTDDEVSRLMSQRAGREEKFASQLAAMTDTVDWLPADQRTRGRLYVVAQPVSRPPVALTDAVAGKHMLDLLLPLIQQYQPAWASSFQYFANAIHHPDGLAAANWPPEQWDREHEDHLAFLQLRDDGTVLFASGDLVRNYGKGGPAAISLPAACETVQQVAALGGHLASNYLRYLGQWRLGVHATGLQGLYPSQRHSQSYGGHRFTQFPNDTYTRTSVVGLDQLTDPSSAVVESVLTNLARGLNLDRTIFPYTHMEELERKLRHQA